MQGLPLRPTQFGSFDHMGKKFDFLVTPQVSDRMDELSLSDKFLTAIENGFIGKSGQGIKLLSPEGDKPLYEVKILGHSSNGKCKTGDMRLLCLFERETRRLSGFEVCDHEEVKEVVRVFKKSNIAFVRRIEERIGVAEEQENVPPQAAQRAHSRGGMRAL